MASYYSEHFQSTQAAAATSADTDYRVPTKYDGRVRTKIATIKNVTFATSDRWYVCQIRSSDIILGLRAINADGGTDVPGTLGLEKTDGTVVDADFFTADIVFETARAAASAGDVVTLNVPAVADTTNTYGLPIWQQLGLSADPFLTYNVILVVGTVSSGDAMSAFLRLDYLAGT